MLSFKELMNEIAEPKAGDEQRFKAKHIVQVIDDPHMDKETREGTKKSPTKKKRLADLEKGQDEAVYEQHMMTCEDCGEEYDEDEGEHECEMNEEINQIIANLIEECIDVNELTEEQIVNLIEERIDIANLTEEQLDELIGRIVRGAANLVKRTVVNKHGNFRFGARGRADSQAQRLHKQAQRDDRDAASADRLAKARKAANDAARKRQAAINQAKHEKSQKPPKRQNLSNIHNSYVPEDIERKADVKMVKVKQADGSVVMRKERPKILIGKGYNEETMSDAEMKKREDIVKGMKKSEKDLKDRYGDRWKTVMYATATKKAMEEVELDEADAGNKQAVEKAIAMVKSIMKVKKKTPKDAYSEWERGTTFGPQLKAMVKKSVMKEEVELDEDITKMSHGRLKFHVDNKFPHGSYTQNQMKAERDRRLKTGEGNAYKAAKPSLSEEADKTHAVNRPKSATYRAAHPVAQPEHANKFADARKNENNTNRAGLSERELNAHKVAASSHDAASQHHRDMSRRARTRNTKNYHNVAARFHDWAHESHKNVYDKGNRATHHDIHVAHRTGKRANEESRDVQNYTVKRKASGRVTNEEFNLNEAFKVGPMKLKDGSTVKLTNEDVQALDNLYKNLNASNRNKMQEKLEANKKSFGEILAFAKETL